MNWRFPQARTLTRSANNFTAEVLFSSRNTCASDKEVVQCWVRRQFFGLLAQKRKSCRGIVLGSGLIKGQEEFGKPNYDAPYGQWHFHNSTANKKVAIAKVSPEDSPSKCPNRNCAAKTHKKLQVCKAVIGSKKKSNGLHELGLVHSRVIRQYSTELLAGASGYLTASYSTGGGGGKTLVGKHLKIITKRGWRICVLQDICQSITNGSMHDSSTASRYSIVQVCAVRQAMWNSVPCLTLQGHMKKSKNNLSENSTSDKTKVMTLARNFSTGRPLRSR